MYQDMNLQHSYSGSATTSRQNGFTVIEVGVAMIIFTIVMAGVYGLLQVGRSGRLNTHMRSEILQNSRVAINTIGRDIINAGVGYPNVGSLVPDNQASVMFGGTADADAIADFITPVFSRNSAGSVNGTQTDQISLAYIDDTFNGNVSLPVSASNASGDTLTVPIAFDTTNCQTSDLYVISGQTSTAALGMLTGKTARNTGTGVPGTLLFQSNASDPLNINQPGANSIIKTVAFPASIQRVRMVRYLVIDEDGAGNGTGTLVRDVYDGAATTGFTRQPLAFGIENFQVQYIMKDGTVTDAPAADQMTNIRQVRVSVAVRSPDIDPRTNQPYRADLTATFSARNLDFEKN